MDDLKFGIVDRNDFMDRIGENYQDFRDTVLDFYHACPDFFRQDGSNYERLDNALAHLVSFREELQKLVLEAYLFSKSESIKEVIK